MRLEQQPIKGEENSTHLVLNFQISQRRRIQVALFKNEQLANHGTSVSRTRARDEAKGKGQGTRLGEIANESSSIWATDLYARGKASKEQAEHAEIPASPHRQRSSQRKRRPSCYATLRKERA
eukprot:757202-Hanusia_phi.AAC.2